MTRTHAAVVLVISCALLGCSHSSASSEACAPESDVALCEAGAAQCGVLEAADRCGGVRVVDCGECAAGYCGYNTPNRCGCRKTPDADLCARRGASCGRILAADPCVDEAREIDCGTCALPLTCGGAGTPNDCGCRPPTEEELCAVFGRACGSADVVDVCGRLRHITCGTCGGSAVCTADATGGCGCEAPQAACARVGFDCGMAPVEDACGGEKQVSCGECAGSQVCGASGAPNVCGCAGDTPDVLCARAGAECGAAFVQDSCGVYRSVDCGGCAPGELCGAGGVDGRCEPLTCGGDGWCWENPLPQGGTLEAIWGASDQSAWAVGPHALILRWDGARWSKVPSPVAGVALHSVWGRGETEVWAVGGDTARKGVVLRYDGAQWSAYSGLEIAALNAISGNAAGEAWMVGDAGALVRWRSGAWVAQPASGIDASLTGVSVFPDGRAAAIGDDAFVCWSGTSWGQCGWQRDSLEWIWGRSLDDYWVSGPAGYCHVLAGDALHAQCNSSPGHADTSFFAARAFGVDASTTWVASTYEYAPDGDRATTQTSSIVRVDAAGEQTHVFTARDGRVVRGIWGARADALWAVGEDGLTMHYDGRAWSAPHALSMADLTAVGVLDDGTAWAGGQGPELLRRVAGQGWVSAGPSVRAGNYSWPTLALSASGDQAWAIAGNSGYFESLLRLRNGNWEYVSAVLRTHINSVVALGQDEAWVVGEQGASYRCHASGCTQLASPGAESLRAVWGTSTGDIWVGGDGATLRHYDGAAWTPATLTTAADSTVVALWGTGASVWALVVTSTNVSEIHRYTGSGWVKEHQSLSVLRAMCGMDADRVWAVGDHGAIAARAQGAWTAKASGTTQQLRACAAKAPYGVWVVGDGGAILTAQ